MNDIVINYLIKNEVEIENEKEKYLHGIEVLELKAMLTFSIIAVSILNYKLIEMILLFVLYSCIRSIIGEILVKTRVDFVISIVKIKISKYNTKLLRTIFIIMVFPAFSLIFKFKSVPMTLLLSMSFSILFKLIDTISIKSYKLN